MNALSKLFILFIVATACMCAVHAVLPTHSYAQIYVPQDQSTNKKKKKPRVFNWFGKRKTQSVRQAPQSTASAGARDRGRIAGIDSVIEPIEFDMAATIGEVEDKDAKPLNVQTQQKQSQGLSLRQLQSNKSNNCSAKEQKFLNTIRSYLTIKTRNDAAIANGQSPIRAVQTKNYKSVDSFMKSKKAPQYIELISQKCK